MKASSVCALLLGVMASTLDALPTNATTPENPSRQTFDFNRAVGQVNYYYSGSCDTTTQYEYGLNSVGLDYLVLNFLSERRSEPIRIETPYINIILDTELSMQFPMRGGFPINYGTGADMIDILRDYFLDNPSLDRLPCRGSISTRGNVKFAFTLDRVLALALSLQPSSVRARGKTWPSRQLATATVDSLIQEADQYMSYQNPIDFVPNTEKRQWGPLGGPLMSWDWTLNREQEIYQLTWSESRQILTAIRRYFHSHVTAEAAIYVEVQGGLAGS